MSEYVQQLKEEGNFIDAYLVGATRSRVIELFGNDRTCCSVSSSLAPPKQSATTVRKHGVNRQPSLKGQAEAVRRTR